MKNLTLIIGILLIVLNTLVGLIVANYATHNFLLADLSLALSAGIIYFIACCKILDGFKIGLTVLFCITGIARYLCMLLTPEILTDNILVVVAIIIFFFEIICLAASIAASKKR